MSKKKKTWKDLVEKFINMFRYWGYKKPFGYPLQSGIVNSDYPVSGNGYFKGFVNSRDSCIIAAHANPTIGVMVYTETFDGDKVYREVESMKIDKENDIALLILNEKWPENVFIYGIADSFEKGSWCMTINQHSEWSYRRIRKSGGMVVGFEHDHDLTPGDSGLPWFVMRGSEFKVVGITSRVDYGISPDLTRMEIKKWVE